MNCIAYSLYGTDPRYLIGAVENVVEAQKFYPGWKCCFWVGRDVPTHTMMDLRMKGAILFYDTMAIGDGMFWRFQIHDVPQVERYIVRDVDSRPSWREVNAVNEWINFETRLHVMRDHPWHHAAILGGMWGLKKQEKDFNMRKRILDWIAADPNERGHGKLKDYKWPSETFLKEEIWYKTESRTVHDSCGAFDGTVNWPIDGPSFIGEYVAPDGSVREDHREIRLKSALV